MVCFHVCQWSQKTSGSSESDTMSWGEFIELRELRTNREQIELTATHAPCSPPRLERTNALRISPGKVPDLLSRVGIIRVLSSTQDPQLPEEKGRGTPLPALQPRSAHVVRPVWRLHLGPVQAEPALCQWVGFSGLLCVCGVQTISRIVTR